MVFLIDLLTKSRIIWTKIEKRSLNQIWTFSGPLWEFFYPIQWSMHKIWVLWRVLIYQNPFRKHIFWPLCSNLKKVGLIWNKGGYARFRLPLSTCLCMCTQVGSLLSIKHLKQPTWKENSFMYNNEYLYHPSLQRSVNTKIIPAP